uniref:Uncharacterized protein n=1 Tax=Rhizophora mucronata TaxID=61149 RepID=A0A2P2IH51_RHIMU
MNLQCNSRQQKRHIQIILKSKKFRNSSNRTVCALKTGR